MTLEKELKTWLKNCRKLVILGIGNPLKMDDALGVEILNQLKSRMPRSVKLIECQTMPENFTGEIKRLMPSHVLMLDAACFGARPGTARVVAPDEIGGAAVSTHAVPLSMLGEIIQQDTGAKVMLLGVQPKAVDFGEGLTPELRRAAKRVTAVLVRVSGALYAC